MDIKSIIRTIPDYPRPGILFRDITPLLKDPQGLRFSIEKLARDFFHKKFDYIAGIESRGFIIGSPLAGLLNKGFIPIRKEGRLPRETLKAHYQLEYGKGTLEIHRDALSKGDKVVVVDDLLATGGTMLCATSLIEELGGVIEGMGFVIELSDLGGGKKMAEKNYTYSKVCQF